MSERIQVVDLRPGDMIIVHYDGFLTREQRPELSARIKESFPDNEVKILEGGMDMSVARPGANELLERTAVAVEKLVAHFEQMAADEDQRRANQAEFDRRVAE